MAAARNWAAYLPDPLRRSRWSVGLIRQPIEEVIRQRHLPAPTWLRAEPLGGYYADPFPLRVLDDRAVLLVEQYDDRRERGRIVELEVAYDGTLLSAEDRHVPDHHASYPFLLQADGRILCVPETHQAGRAEAFDLTDGSWRPAATLLPELGAVDATLVEHEGRWWLFCTLGRDHGALHLFVADDWRGPFRPHPDNPVKVDPASGRPAGALVRVDGELYRPAQDCSRTYGGAVTINRVLELSPRRYREETAFVLRPDPDGAWPAGLHTLNGLGALTVVDGKRWGWGAWPC